MLATCGKCHQGATSSSSSTIRIPNPRDYARAPLLWWANRVLLGADSRLLRVLRAAQRAVVPRARGEERRDDARGATGRCTARAPCTSSRFDRRPARLHVVVMVTFLGLAATGMPLLFSEAPWARAARDAVRRIPRRRPCAPRLRRHAARRRSCGTSATRLARVRARRARHLLGAHSMVPQPRDFVDFFGADEVVLRPRPAAEVRPLHLLGEVRLLGGVLGHGDHGRGRA